MKRTCVRRGALSLVVVLGLVPAVGCGDSGKDVSGKSSPGPGSASNRSKSSGTPKIMFVTNSNSDWWNAVEKGMEDGGKEFGCDVLMKRNDGKTQGQVDKLLEVLSLAEVDAVAVSVIEADAPGVLDAMRELQKSGKIVLTIDSDVSPRDAELRSGYIGTNNARAGEAAGRAAAALRPEGGKVVASVGTSSAANAREREQGFFQGAGEKFIRVETWEDGGDTTKAGSNVVSAITKTPDLGILLGLWSYNAWTIAGEVRKSPKVREQATVITFDLDEATVKDLSEGFIDATVCQNPYEMGYQAVKVLRALIQKDDKAVKEVLTDGKTRDTGVRVIVPKADSPVLKQNKSRGDDVITIEEMRSWLSSKGLKSS